MMSPSFATRSCSTTSAIWPLNTPQVIAQLSVVSSKVDTLRSAQDSLTLQVDTLRGKVDQANLLAEARAANTRVQDLITGEREGVRCIGGRHMQLSNPSLPLLTNPNKTNTHSWTSGHSSRSTRA